VASAVIWDNQWVASQLSENKNGHEDEHERNLIEQHRRCLHLIKDSKKLSQKNRDMLYEFIVKNCRSYSIEYVSENIIDEINILNATYNAMHGALNSVVKTTSFHKILVDGDRFRPYMNRDPTIEYLNIPHICVPSGDNVYLNIASASILAKVSRDNYINDLVKSEPELEEKYNLKNNKGYGTKKHLDGIHKYGISKYHRNTFGICKQYAKK